MIRIHVLGPLELQSADRVWVPRGPKIRKLLGVLALRAGAVVDLPTLAEELWDDSPPSTMSATIRSHIYHLRVMLRKECGLPEVADLLRTEPAGYRLAMTPEQVDATDFDTLVRRGRALLERDQAAACAMALGRALALWRGPMLADVDRGPVLSRHATRLDEARLRAIELRIEADLRLGRHRDLVAELRALVAVHPLNEWLHGRLIEALRRSGRRAEALAAFAELRRTLVAELGIEPGAELRLLQQSILTSDDAVLAS